MGYSRKSKSHVKKNTTFALNITSMTDMFTIMLVFLLQNYSTDLVHIEMEPGIRLPSSETEKNPVPGVLIVVTKDLVKVDKKVLFQMKDAQVPDTQLDPKDTNFIKSLFAELEEYNKTLPDQNPAKGRILLQADSGLSYGTIRKVFYTASLAGFPQLKMITTVGRD